MAILLPAVEKRPQYGFLSGLSNSLSQGLAGAAQSQFDQFQQRRQQEAKRESLRKIGVPESLSEYILNLSPSEQFEALGQYVGGQESQPGQEFLSSLSGELAPQQQQSPQPQGQVADILGALGGSQQAKGLESLLSPPQQKQLRFQQQFGVAPQAAAPQPKVPEVPAQQASQPQLSEEQKFFKQLARGKAEAGAGKVGAKGALEKKWPVKVIEQANKAIDTADQIESIVDEMDQLLQMKDEEGNYQVASESLWPEYFQNETTQRFITLGNELAALEATRGGTASVFKIKLTQQMKPNPKQKRGAQIAALGRAKKVGQEFRSAGQRILGSSEEGSPQEQQVAPQTREDKFLDQLPPANQAKIGKPYRNTETGQVAISDGKKWTLQRS
jgi:hypothetical protein